jgi:membrane protein YqaA with SNARE-associated domain
MFKAISAKLGYFLFVYGGWGLFAISFLDSSFIPFPLFNDLALIMMASRRPEMAPVFALQSTLGSLLGAFLLYGIARRGGKFLWRNTPPKTVVRVERWLQRNDFVALLVASLLPPPAPLKVFVLMAGALEVNAVNFGIAMVIGRGLRFGADAWLGARYGIRAQNYLRDNSGWASLATIALILGVTLVSRRLKKRYANEVPANPARDSTTHMN